LVERILSAWARSARGGGGGRGGGSGEYEEGGVEVEEGDGEEGQGGGKGGERGGGTFLRVQSAEAEGVYVSCFIYGFQMQRARGHPAGRMEGRATWGADCVGTDIAIAMEAGKLRWFSPVLARS
jgi:hypothetical protein